MGYFQLVVVSLFQDYYKALEDADEKVQLANQIYDLVSFVFTSNNMHKEQVFSHTHHWYCYTLVSTSSGWVKSLTVS